MTRKRLPILLAAAVLVAGGCTPDVYKRWADSQVGDILKDRKQQTLGYQPEVEAASTVPDKPSKAAYEKIPVTPIPPVGTPPLEPSVVTVPFGQLGPDVPEVEEKGAISKPRMGNPYDRSALNGASLDRMRLGPPTPAELGTQLDLFRSIEYAVQHSREYQGAMEQVYLQTLDVTLQRHLFSPRPFVAQSVNIDGGTGDVAYRSSLHAVTTAGVRQQLPYGGEVVAQALAGTVQAISGNVTEGEEASVVMSASIPLLRGFGLVNLEPLINSERQLVYQIRDFEDFRREFAVNIATAYFNLITRQQQLANTRFNYANLAILTARTQALYQAGRINFLEVQRSAQQQLQSESTLIVAENGYQTAVDQFKITLGMPIDTDLEIVPVELDMNVPNAEPSRAIQLATQFRLDLQSARDRIEDARRGVSNAKNGLLPDLRLNGSYNFAPRAGDAASDVFDERGRTYSAGITLDLPVDRVRERNEYRRSLISLQQSQRNYELLRDRISVNARDALRGIEAATQNLEIQRIGIELAQKRLDYANELLKSTLAGSNTSSRDTVEAQQDLLTAQNAYAVARSNLQISILNYLRETGTLRVDPTAGALGKAMDRAAAKVSNSAMAPLNIPQVAQ